jgi:AcrR family transcriptional regulator
VSPLREAQTERTRSAVLDAAAQLFEERGWKGTGMRDIAATAGVAVETVYAKFGSKTELLKQALDIAVVGDTAPVPLAERSAFRRLNDGSAADRIHAATEMLVGVRQRTARMRRVLNQAAEGNSQLTALLADVYVSERESVRQASLLVARRDVSDHDVDALFAILSTEPFLLLTEVRGWSVTAYQAWTARMIRAVLRLKGEDDDD